MAGQSAQKIEAIYELRAAAEYKAHVEIAAALDATPAARDALLDAKLQLEAKTQDAIDICHECGGPHADCETSARHEHNPGRSPNVIEVDFKRPDGD